MICFQGQLVPPIPARSAVPGACCLVRPQREGSALSGQGPVRGFVPQLRQGAAVGRHAALHVRHVGLLARVLVAPARQRQPRAGDGARRGKVPLRSSRQYHRADDHGGAVLCGDPYRFFWIGLRRV